MIAEAPCVATGVCPNPALRDILGTKSIAELADTMNECSRVLGKIITAGDESAITTDLTPQSESDENVLVFGPNPCPMMTTYSLELVEENK